MNQYDYGVVPTGNPDEPFEFLIFLETKTARWKVMLLAPSYGIKRFGGISDPDVQTDVHGRIPFYT